MNEQIRLAHNAGVARAISLAEQSANIIEAEGNMAGPRDPVSVEALRTFAQEAVNLFRAPQAVEAIAEESARQQSRAEIEEA